MGRRKPREAEVGMVVTSAGLPRTALHRHRRRSRMIEDYASPSEWPVGYTLAWPMNLIFDTYDHAWARQSSSLNTGHQGQPRDERSTTTYYSDRPARGSGSGRAIDALPVVNQDRCPELQIHINAITIGKDTLLSEALDS